MIAESGHYALVLALGLALIQSIVPVLGAHWRDAALMNVARSTSRNSPSLSPRSPRLSPCT